MSVRIRLVPVVSLLLGLMGLGCAPTHRAAFLIASPHDNDTFPSGQAVTVRVDTIDLTHVNGETWESYDYEVFDNGDLVARRTHVPLTNRNPYEVIAHPADGLHWVDVNGRIARTRYFFGDPEPVYSDWYALNVCFWVGPNPPPDFCSVRTIVQAARVATPTPTRVPPTPTAVPVILEAEAFPNPLYYGETCPSLSSVTLRAALAVPEGMTAQQLDVKAHVSVMVGTSSGNVGGLVVPLEATQTWDVSTGGQEFEGTLDLSHAYADASNHFDPAAMGGASGALLWYVDAAFYDSVLQTAELLERSPNQVIDLAPCPTQDQPRDRRPGGGSAPGGSGTGCGQYTNQLSCNLAGCSWVPQSSACIISP